MSDVHKRVHSMDEEPILPVPTTFTPKPKANRLHPIDRPQFFVLVVLYLLQGVPVGLAFGSVPFILKTKLSYSQVGIFTLALYPYSLKLIWSPIIDAVYLRSIGRRKSWIIPIQLTSGLTLLYLGSMINELFDHPENHLVRITTCFFLLVFFCATQDIAVDGWALTCLLADSLSFALTAQTIGMNMGYYFSFTLFLTLSSPDFANKYVRLVPLDHGLINMGQYLTIWGWVFLIVTAILYFIPEEPAHLKQVHEKSHKPDFNDMSEKSSLAQIKDKLIGVQEVYTSMFQVLKLSNIQILIVILLISKLGFQVNEAATNLKLIEKGLSKEDLSITVLINFPFEMILGYYAGRWSNGKQPLRPWIIGFGGRLLLAAAAQALIYCFPASGQVSLTYFAMIVVQHLFSSFMATIQFVLLCAFFNKIADPAIGGTYMTTLNTVSNYGGTWPRIIIFYMIDRLSLTNCVGKFPITSELLKEKCISQGGVVQVLRDGYYYTNFICVSLGIVILFWVKRKAAYLQSLPASAWRVNKEKA